MKRKNKVIIALAFLAFIGLLFQMDKDVKRKEQESALVQKNIETQIVNERDTSIRGRKRGQFEVYAPEAVTKDERENVLKSIAQKYADQGYEYFDIRLVPVNDPEYTTYFGYFGRATYDADGCGPSGRDCGNKKWVSRTSSHVLSDSDKSYINSFIKNHKATLYDFNNDPDNWTAEEQERLDREFLEGIARDLGVKPEDVSAFMVFPD